MSAAHRTAIDAASRPHAPKLAAGDKAIVIKVAEPALRCGRDVLPFVGKVRGERLATPDPTLAGPVRSGQRSFDDPRTGRAVLTIPADAPTARTISAERVAGGGRGR